MSGGRNQKGARKGQVPPKFYQRWPRSDNNHDPLGSSRKRQDSNSWTSSSKSWQATAARSAQGQQPSDVRFVCFARALVVRPASFASFPAIPNAPPPVPTFFETAEIYGKDLQDWSRTLGGWPSAPTSWTPPASSANWTQSCLGQFQTVFRFSVLVIRAIAERRVLFFSTHVSSEKPKATFCRFQDVRVEEYGPAGRAP